VVGSEVVEIAQDLKELEKDHQAVDVDEQKKKHEKAVIAG